MTFTLTLRRDWFRGIERVLCEKMLFDPDQQVAAFALPGTSRPEGFRAAQETGTLIQLGAAETTQYSVTTGLVAADGQER